MNASAFSQRSLVSGIRKRGWLRAAITLGLMPGLLLFSIPVGANPSGGIVVHGDVRFGGSAGNLQITQNSQNAIINWDDFSIDAGELTQFVQPGTNAAVLNRVTGLNPSVINGALQANGNLFLINPSGILVGASGTIDVHGLAMSTLDISNGEFLAGGDMVFEGQGEGITNMGRINAIGGDVFLIGKTVSNYGSITAANGTVGLAAGQEVLLQANPDSNGERIFVRATGAGASGTGVLNDGTIEGAAVELKAHGNMFALAINNKGSVRATGVTNSGGRVFLNGMGGSISNSGSIQATAPSPGNSASVLIKSAYAKVDGMIRAANADGSGGDIRITGSSSVELGGRLDASGASAAGGEIIVEAEDIELTATADVDASGINGGGAVSIGGGFQGNDPSIDNATTLRVAEGASIRVNSAGVGNGGSVILWADDTNEFEGTVSAASFGMSGNGGFVEVSGKNTLFFGGLVSTLSHGGSNGTLLLDPTNITISGAGTSANVVNTGNLQTALASGSVIISTQSGGGEDGWIQVLDNVRWDSSNSLTLLAEDDIYVENDIRNRGSGAVNLIAGWDSTAKPISGFSSGTANQSPFSNPITSGGTVDMSVVFSDTALFGQDINGNGNAATGVGMGSVFLGQRQDGTQIDGPMMVGSRLGETNVAAYDLEIRAGNTNDDAVNLGYAAENGDDDVNAGFDDASGSIRVLVQNDVRIETNQTTSNLNGAGARLAHGQIGHGGRWEQTRNKSLTGDITVEAINGDIIANGGGNDRSFAKIGHGGSDAGGGNALKEIGGKIDVSAGGDIVFTAGHGYRTFTQIGHGGADVDTESVAAGDNSITVEAGGDIRFAGGTGTQAESREGFSILGHGGRYSDTTASTTGSWNGDIKVVSGGVIEFKGGNGASDFVHLGHGGEGSRSGTSGGFSGNIDLSAGGDITFLAGTMRDRSVANGYIVDNNGDTGVHADGRIYAQLGHGGYNSDASGNDTYTAGVGHSGDIKVVSTGGGLSILGGDTAEGSAGANQGRLHYSRLGHGGSFANGDHNGAIQVDVSGAIRVKGSANTDASFLDNNDGLVKNRSDLYGEAAIGHGGQAPSWGANPGGNYSGDAVGGLGLADGISVKSGGNISVIGGGGRRSFAQIGLGGYATEGSGDADIRVDSGGDIFLSVGGAPGAWGTATSDEGSENFAQIGNGGYEADGDQSGNIVVRAAGILDMRGGNDAYRNHAQIGHGGTRSNGNHTGQVSVLVQGTGKSVMQAGQGVDSDESHVQIGHGGYAASGGNKSGDVEVIIAGDLDFVSGANGSGGNSYALIGHGGTGMGGADEVSGDVDVLIDGELSIVRSDARAQMGHIGGTLAREAGDGTGSDLTVIAGSIDHNVSASDNLFRITNDAGFAEVQNNWINPYLANNIGDVVIGTKGTGSVEWADVDYDYNSNQDLTLLAGGNISFSRRIRAREQTNGGDLSIIGNYGGAVGASSVDTALDQMITSDFSVSDIIADAAGATPTWMGTQGGVVTLGEDAAGNGASTWVALGSSTGTTTVMGHDILLKAGGDLGANGRAVQIGMRDGTSGFSHTGDINVFASQDVQILGGTTGGPGTEAGTTQAWGMIGHGGIWNDGRLPELSGDITVNAGRDVIASSGTNEYNFTQIGHGGVIGYDTTAIAADPSRAPGKVYGDIDVDARTGKIAFSAGHGRNAYSQLGHGGRNVELSGLDSSAAAESSNISATAGGDITFDAGMGSGAPVAGSLAQESYAQLGHGGWGSQSRTAGEGWYGDINVDSGGLIRFKAGDIQFNHAQLGHGGRSVNAGAGGGHSGNITVNAVNDISFIAGTLQDRASRGMNVNQNGELFAMLGHGGLDADANGGNTNAAGVGHSGDIFVRTTSGGVNVTGGSVANGSAGDGQGREQFSQIGHGGRTVAGQHSGSIDVIAEGGDISVLAGTTIDNDGGHHNHAMIGHGGSGGANWGVAGGTQSSSSVNGGTDGIRVNASQDVLVHAGDSNSFAMIGLGGNTVRGEHTGDVSVTGGRNVSVMGGLGEVSFAHIGNGGYNSDEVDNTAGNAGHSGDVSVTATSGSITLAAGGGGHLGWGNGSNSRKHAMIGNGGYQDWGNHNGNVKVRAGTSIDILAGTSYRDFAKIGNGGWQSKGDMSGVVSVVAGTSGAGGDIRLIANQIDSSTTGDGTTAGEAFVQIGHGGHDSDGNMSGNVEVVANAGKIDLVSGRYGNDFALIGHGGSGVDGTMDGSIAVIADGELSADNQLNGQDVRFVHRGTSINSGDFLLDVGGLDDDATVSKSVYVVNDAVRNSIFRPYLNDNLNDADLGHVFFSTGTTDIRWDSTFTYASTKDLNILTEGDIFLTQSIQNREDIDGGALNIVAGWDGVSGGSSGTAGYSLDFNECEVVVRGGGVGSNAFDVSVLKAHSLAQGENATQFGVDGGNGGDVFIGSDENGTNLARLVAVGSASGDTNVLGRDVMLAAGSDTPADSWERTSQIGFREEVANPNFDAANPLVPGQGELIDVTGNIMVLATRDVQLDAAIVPGGLPNQHPNNGDVMAASVARIGHGGFDRKISDRAVLSGMVMVDAGRDITGNGGNTLDGHVQIGHGGRSNSNTNVGDPPNYRPSGHVGGEIDVRSRTGDIEFTAGEGNRAFALIGNGGISVRPEAQDATINTDVTVVADTGSIILRGGVSANNDNNSAFAMIGNGGHESDVITDGQGWHGDVTVTAGGLIDFRGGSGESNFAQLGHGGWSSTSGASLGGGAGANGTGHIGDILVTAGTGINFIAGTASAGEPADTDSGGYAMLGHGGRDSDVNANGGFAEGMGHMGDISVTSTTGNINFHGGDNDAALGALASAGAGTGRFLFSQLGHGGYGTAGAHTGAIKVDATAGSINFRAGNANDNSTDVYHFAQLGHSKNNDGQAYDLSAANAGLTGTTGLGLGLTSGIEVNAGDAINFTASTQRRSQAQLGLGGYAAAGDHSGDIRVTSGAGGITFQAGLGASGADGQESNAQIGHGGNNADGSHFGKISVTTTGGGDISFTGGTSNDNYAQIGHGGRSADGNMGDDGTRDGDVSKITVNSSGGISFGGGAGTTWGQSNTYAQIGHGGFQARGDHVGDIDVDAVGDILFTSGTSYRSYSMIGNGGWDADQASADPTAAKADRQGNLGDIAVSTADGNISFTTRGLREGFGQIGHGGYATAGDMSGTITVEADIDGSNFGTGGNITFDASGSINEGSQFMMIGHGGLNSSGGNTGAISVHAGDDIAFTGGNSDAFGQIGHGGRNDHRVNFDADGDDNTVGTADDNTYNNGNDQYFSGTQKGDITVLAGVDATGALVNAGADLTLLGGSRGNADRSGVQIGHGGFRSAAEFGSANGNGHNGTITVLSSGAVAVTGGRGNQAPSMIGHGGYEAFGDHFGDIVVEGRNGVSLAGGPNASRGDQSFVQIGHGGHDADFDATRMLSNEGQVGAAGVAATGSGTWYNVNVDLQAATGTHGNITVRAGKDSSGAVTNAAADLAAAAGADADGYVKIGHGGRLNSGDHGLGAETISIDVARNLTLTGGGAGRADAQIGNGGSEAAPVTAGHAGEISIEAGGDITVAGGTADDTYAHVGHGGRDTDAVTGHTGNISVIANGANGISFTAGNHNESYAQLGHGGDRSNGDHNGKITLDSKGGDILFASGSASPGQFWVSYAQVGHGGYEAKGDRSGEIDIDAAGNVTLDATNGGRREYAQIGHGGWNADDTGTTNNKDDISITTTNGGDLILKGSDRVVGGPDPEDSTNGSSASESYVQVGHGGQSSTGGYLGDITVDVAGKVSLNGGKQDNSFAQVGHGGFQAAGSNTGNIDVGAAENIEIFSGTGATAYAKIGFGGRDAAGTQTGDIYVHGATGVTLDSGSGGQHGFTQIGHGGYNSAGAHSGFVTVTNSTSGAISLQGGSGVSDRTSQIGHGGINNGNNALSGSISVVNLGGDVTVAAGDGSWRGAIIGHGDAQEGQTSGARTGGLNVYASGDITMTDGGGNSGAYISHQTNSGIAQVSYAGSGVQAAGDSGYSLVTNGSLTFGNDQLVGPNNAIAFNETLLSAINQGDVSIGTSDNLDLTPAGATPATVVYNSANSFTFASGGNLNMGFGLQNQGTGDINLFAGYDLTNTPFAPPAIGSTTLVLGSPCLPDFSPLPIPLPTNCDVYGQNNGAITIGSASQTEAVLIGSRQGSTNAFGYGVTLTGSNSTANAATQLGFYSDGSGDMSGDINVGVKMGGLTLNSGSQTATYAQIGHGGFNAAADSTTAAATVTISFCEPGDLNLNGGAGADSYARIGHGQSGQTANHDGAISVGTDTMRAGAVNLNGGAGSFSRAQIGNGGRNVSGTKAGAISVYASNGVTLQTGDGGQSDAVIGHGGNRSNGNRSGAIIVDSSAGDISITAGNGVGKDSAAGIGHNGQSATGDLSGQIDVVASSGSVAINGGSAQTAVGSIGHGGTWRGGFAGDTITGAINVSAAENISLAGSQDSTAGITGNNRQNGGVLIGHGGATNAADKSGDITVTADSDGNNVGNISLVGGARGGRFTQIGHGGTADGGFAGTNSGSITARGHDIILTGGNGGNSHAKIGHGATGASDAQGIAVNVIDIGGNSLRMTSGGGGSSYAQIGSGGINATGAVNGDICVHLVNDAILDGAAGGGDNSYVQIGHGGFGAITGAKTGNIVVTTGTTGTGGLTLNGGDNNSEYAQIGHGGTNSGGAMSGDIYTIADRGGNIALNGGDNSTTNYSMIGHGDGQGATSSGTREGGIHIFADANLTGTDGNAGQTVNAWHQTNGGLTAGDYLGGDGFQIFQDLNGLPAGATDTSELAVMAAGNFGAGNVNIITSADTDIVFDGGGSGDLFVNSSDDFYFVTGGSITFENSYQNAGAGDVIIVAGWNGVGTRPPATVEYQDLGGGVFNYCAPKIRESGVQIDFNDCAVFGNDPAGDGNFGTITLGSATQDTAVRVGSRSGRNVAAGYGLTILGGDTANASSQFGYYSGSVTTGDMSGAVDVFVKDGGVTLTGGSAAGTYAQIGHGGFGAAAGNTTSAADITISFCAPGDLTLTGGGANNAYARIGNGINGQTVNMDGDINIGTATARAGAITLNGGAAGNDTVARIGHGGTAQVGTSNGNINLYATDAITLAAGTGTRADSAIGHGANQTDGARSGNIYVNSSAGNISVSGGDGRDSASTIGHTGQNSNGSLSGNIDVISDTGSVSVAGGGGQTAMGSIGHGGTWRSAMAGDAISGAINVSAASGVSLTGGQGGGAGSAANGGAMIGHGGSDNDGNKTGDITVTGDSDADNVGDIALTGGATAGTFAKIGHGAGTGSIGDAAGSVTVTGQDIALTGGAGNAYAQIGHGAPNAGGANGDGIDDIVSVTGNSVALTSGAGVNAYAQIGMGGLAATGAQAADIHVFSNIGVTLDSSVGAGDGSYAQIGNGGLNAAGGVKSGFVTVVSGLTGAGDITLTGGDNLNEYAQIGHGGVGANGNVEGSISLLAQNNSNVVLNGGTAASNYALVGHGDGEGVTTGNRTGGVNVFAQGGITGTDGTAGASLIGHQTAGGIGAVSYAGSGIAANGDEGYSIVGASGNVSLGATQVGGTGAVLGLVETFEAAAATADVLIGAGGNLSLLGDGTTTIFTAANDITLAAGGNLNVGFGMQNTSSGDITLVSGLDLVGNPFTAPTTAGALTAPPAVGTFCLPDYNPNSFAIDCGDITGTGIVTIGAVGQTSSLAIGSQGGTTTVAGYGVTLQASNTAADAATQIGFQPDNTGAVNGAINVLASTGGLNMLSGSADGTSTLIGHGRNDNSSNVPIDATITVSFCEPGDVVMDAGAGEGSYSRIGHGIFRQSNARDGEINVTNFRNITMSGDAGAQSYAQIGHGGFQGFGNTNATINLTGATDPAQRGNVTMRSGAGTNSYTQVGHGGRDTGWNNTKAGAINITQINDLDAQAGAGHLAYTQVGNGGHGSTSEGSGKITVNAGGDIKFAAGRAPASNWGVASEQYAMLGHGGLNNRADHNGEIDVDAAGNIEFTSGNTIRAFAMIGNGGTESDSDPGTGPGETGSSGKISVVSSGGNIVFAGTTDLGSGTRRENYVQIGHGGTFTHGDHNGEIEVEATTGSISFSGGASGDKGSARIGHGGELAQGNLSGAISVIAGNGIAFEGGTTGRSNAQIGHGGHGDDETVTSGNADGMIKVQATDGDIVFTGRGSESNAMLGHLGHRWSGNATGAIDVDADDGNVTFASGGAGGNQWQGYAQLGHGGHTSKGDRGGTIDLNASGNILFDARNGEAGEYVLLGHGGQNADGNVLANSDITVISGGDLEFFGSTGGTVNQQDGYAQLGHGGSATTGNVVDSDVVVTTGGKILFRGGTNTRSHVQLGHGGRLDDGHAADGDRSGSITVTANGADAVTGNGIEFDSGTNNAYSKLGHGGYDADGVSSGAINVRATAGDIQFTGRGSAGFTQLGHGGFRSAGAISGDIDVDADAGDIRFASGGAGGNEWTGYALLGHGGWETTNGAGGATVSLDGRIDVDANGDITFDARTAERGEFAQIGHGGDQATTNIGANSDSAIVVNSGGRIAFTASTDATTTDSQVMIGHGGARSAGNHSGSINVTSVDEIEFKAGAGENAYARIGHGGDSSGGDHNGAITVSGGKEISFEGGTANDTYAQIGHGGRLSGGTQSGRIEVVSDAGIKFDGNSGNRSYAMIGHGGDESGGTLSGEVVVNARGGNIDFTSGTADRALVRIGHGGAANTTVNASGAIDVDASGNIAFGGGGGTGNWKSGQIGHGGVQAAGTQAGNIDVNAKGNIAFDASSAAGTDNFFRIGHGGHNSSGNMTGDITVVADGAASSIAFTSGSIGQAATQIGHGGFDSTGDFTGAVVVRAQNNVTLSAGTAGNTYSQIGHGGADSTDGDADGLRDGKIAVSTIAGNLDLNSGSNESAYSQIGHGGYRDDGSQSGSIHVDVVGNLATDGGSADVRAYSAIGHGGVANAFNLGNPTGVATGTRSGDILVNVSGGTTLTDNSSIAILGHLTATGAAAGSDLSLITGTLNTGNSAAGVTGIVQSMARSGNVEIGVTNGDLTVDGPGAFFNSGNHVDLIASGNVNFTSSVQNAGAGAVNVAAGWDSLTGLLRTIDHNNCPPIAALSIDYAQIEANDLAFGNNNGSVVIGDGSQTTALAVGSANGDTNVLGYGIDLTGSSAANGASAQIGFNENAYFAATGINGVSSTGNIDVRTKEDGLTAVAGGSDNAFVQVGHGGQSTSAGTFSGDISLDLNRGATPGALTLRGGGGAGASAQIGNGGNSSGGIKSGNIAVTAASVVATGGTGATASARIGNGGEQGGGGVSGAVAVTSTEGAVELVAGTGNFASAAIGNGGLNYNGAISSAPVAVNSATDISLTASAATQSSAMIGNGGNGAQGAIDGAVSAVAAAAINVIAGDGVGSFAQIGNGGGSADGDMSGSVTASAGTNITMTATNAANAAYSKIGNGDDFTGGLAILGGSGSRSGDVTVAAGNDITMTDAMIGHVNSVSSATDTGSTTLIGASRNDPDGANGGGNIVADGASEFSGGSELRFYIPRRANNQIGAGSLLNGVAWNGAEVDPSPTQRIDEFTINVTGDNTLVLDQHDNTLGSGPAPINAGSFAFYYDTIVLEEVILPEVFEPTPPPFSSFFPFDQDRDDPNHENDQLFTGFNTFSIYYEGYDQYSRDGGSIFDYLNGNTLDGQGAGTDEEDVLRRQQRILEEEAEEEAE